MTLPHCVMYEAVSFSLTALTLFNLISVGSFTYGAAQLCPNGTNSTTCEDGFAWDTISEMITRDDRVRNGFAGFLFLSAAIIFFIVSLVLERLDFYYSEIRGIGIAARQSNSFSEFKKLLLAQKSVCGSALLNKVTEANYDKHALIISSDASTPHSTYAIWSPLAFYDKKKKAVWYVYCAAMLSYVGFGIYSTDVSTEVHTALAKAAFALLILLALLLSHLSWNNMLSYHLGQIVSVLSVLTCIFAGVAYAVTSVYWWEYVLVISLHTCLLGISKFRILFAYNNVSIRRYGNGDYRVDFRAPRVEYVNLRL